MKKNIIFLALFFTHMFRAQAVQKHIPTVDKMPDLPANLDIIDYHKLALNFDETVYNPNASGKYWPLIWKDTSHKNFPQDVVALYTAMGDVRQGPKNNNGIFHEALASMGATLGATLVGINKADSHGVDYVGMLKNYFNKDTGWDIMMNNTSPEVAMLGGGYGRDWWYDVYPNVLFFAICSEYPNEPGFTDIARKIAEKFYQATTILKGDYNYSFFDYGKMRPEKNNICSQPDAAAGHAYVMYAAYKKFGDKKYLDAACDALQSLQNQKENPSYEILMPFGAYLSARITAETGRTFNTQKLLEFSFDGTPKCREGWGVLIGNWNGFDISGIVGSTVQNGGYGFLMNTYDFAIPLIPLARYDKTYAVAIGKWMLNAANAGRYFYPQYMPKEHQAVPEIADYTKGVIAYEGLIKKSSYKEYENLPGPVAQGDGPLWVPGKNPVVSQLSVYGSAHVGVFGSIIKNTDVSGILQLDLLATDFFRDKAYPTFLYYNPYPMEKKVSYDPGSHAGYDFYDAIAEKFIAKNSRKKIILTIPAKGAIELVQIPSGAKPVFRGKKMTVNGIVADYNCNTGR